MDLTIHVDGGSRGNPGPAAAAVVVTETGTGKLIHEAGYFLGRATNNEAEYRGLIRAARLAAHLGASSVDFISDSELMVRQITGEYRVKSPDLRPLFEDAQRALLKLDTWTIRHVRRAQNARADQLANMALDAGRDIVVVASPDSGEEVSTGGPAASAKPAWVRLKLAFDPGAGCPAGCDPKTWYTLGPATPDGLCVYAAKAALDHIASGHNASLPTRVSCPHCRTAIQIESAE